MSARTFVIGRHQAGRSLLETLQQNLRWPRTQALETLRARGVRLGGAVCTDPQQRVRSGQRVQVQVKAPPPKKAPPRPAAVAAPKSPLARGVVVRHLDRHLVVVEKPAGLTTVRHKEEAAEFGNRARKFLPTTLVDLLPGVLASQGRNVRGRVRAVHRLDKETSGLLVLALTPDAERHLGQQFRKHTIERRYLALVRGEAKDRRIESHLVRDRGDGRRGSGPAAEGQRAVTHVTVVERLGDFTLVECRLETGRTHQVRIHLGETGTPLCGERVYDRPLKGQPVPDGSGATRPMLHAASLAFDHPADGKPVEWTAAPPEDMRKLLKRLRSANPPHSQSGS